MKKYFITLATLFLFSAVLIAQHSNESCKTEVLHKNLLQQDVQYANEYNRIQTELRTYIELNANNSSRSQEVYTIPLVVHVMHTGQAVGTGVNISDAQIQSAIDNLNDAYSNQSPYTGFNSNIQFVLAQRDPDCNATNGIVRVNASGVSGYSTQGITDANEIDVKALSKWPNTDYYNIWVVSEIDDNNGGGGTQGYAYYPGAPASVDGAVVLYNTFGYDPDENLGYNLKSYTNRNVTTIHELGHGLNLKHTFEGDNEGASCPANNNPDVDGDAVSDTPPHNRNDGDCGSTGNTCAGAGNDLADVVTNFMAYSSDLCQTKFSLGQVNRMRAALETSRPSLITSRGGLPAEQGGYTGPVAASCSPQTQELGNFSGILSTSLNNRTITSGSSLTDGGYLDFSTSCNAYFEINADEPNSVDIRVFTFNFQQLHVWIDWNNDGDFNDANELQHSSQDIPAGTIVNIPLIYPASPPNETYVRMRVSTDLDDRYSGIVILQNSCSQPVDGQVEDYALYVVSSQGGGGGCELSLSTSSTPVSCNGGNDGSASVSLITGVPPYNFLWSNGEQTSSITGLSLGTYSVTATDSEGCSSSASVQVTQPSNLTGSVNIAHESCITNDGSIDLTVSGGTAPYSYTWSTGQNTQDIFSLAAGSYSVTVIDNNSCSTTLQAVVELQCEESPVEPTKVSNPTCGGTIQSINDLIYCNAVVGATNYQWRWVGGGIDEIVSRNSSYNDFKAKMVPGIQNNTMYTVYVRALTSQGWGNFGEACQVNVIGVQNTKLTGNCEGQQISNADNLIYCDAVSGAQDYEWIWINMDEPQAPYERKRSAVYNNFKPSTMFPDMLPGTNYQVAVRARVNNVWGEYSQYCPITSPIVGSTRVQNTWCNKTLSQLFLTIKCSAVSGATDYEWEWTNMATETTQVRRRGNVNNDFSTKWISGFAEGQTWQVRVRAKANGMWGSYGTICVISTPAPQSWVAQSNSINFDETNEEVMDDLSMSEDKAWMMVYPNPSSGEQIKIVFNGIENELKAVVNIYDVYGKQVYRKQLNRVFEGYEITFNNFGELPAGVYFVITQIDNQQLQEKLIIK
jgi:hypothetical protein